jgi:SAM-dependent methyltransferase
MADLYGRQFYDTQVDGSRLSASKVVPTIVNLLQPNSVLDVGCGVGPWCVAFLEAGVSQVHGIDGPWVDVDRFAPGVERFTRFDFSVAATPFEPSLPQRRFDLVVSLEFLEHVDISRASELVDFIACVTDTALISAAVPGQGGTGHVNEQWVDYWATLFAPHGFQALDFLRPLIWDDPEVEPWYRQNLVGFFRQEPPPAAVEIAEAALAKWLRSPRRLVHPDLFERKADNRVWPLARRMVKHLVGRR